MEEPKITVTNIDETEGVGVSPADNRLNILCPVISPAGPLELTQVSSTTEFKRLFMGSSGVSASDEMSVIYARSLVNNAPIWIKRAVKSKMKGGISSETASEVYVDENLNLITGVKFELSPNDIVTVEDTLNEFFESNTTGITQRNSTIYTLSATSFPSTIVSSESSKTVKSILRFTGDSATVGQVIITIGSTRFTFSAGQTNLDYLLFQTTQRGIYPQYVKAETGNYIDTEVASASSLSEFQEIISGVTEIGWVAPTTVTISCADTDDEDKIAFTTYSNSTAEVTLTAYTVKTESENIATWELTNPYIMFQGSDGTTYAIYGGEFTQDVDMSYDIGNSSPTFSEFAEGVADRLASSFDGATAGDDTFILPYVDAVTAGNLDVTCEAINQVVDSERFAIISRFPCDLNYFEVSLSWADEENEVYRINVDYQSESEEWDFGFNASLMDGYGNSLYYDRVNMESELFYIVEMNGEGVTVPMSTTFGNEVTADYVSVSDMVTVLEEMAENEEPTVKFDYICDGGEYNTTLISTIKTLCETYHSFYPVSIPTDITYTQSNIETYRSNISSTYYCNFIPHTQRGNTIDSGSVILPGSYWYLTRRIELGNTSNEFQPLFGVNGYINIDSPLQIYDVDTREDLLDVQVPTLKRTSTGSWSLNRNFTLYRTESYLQEDGIVLMNNKVCQVADQYAENLIGRQNSSELRANVEYALTQQLSQRLRVGNDNAPVSLTVVCNDSNNPQSLQRQGKLRIDIYGTYSASIRDVLIYSTIQAL